MANTLSPLSKDQIDNLYCEINGILEAEFKDESETGMHLQSCDALPTTQTFDKAELLKILRMLEPNTIVFYQDIQKLIQMYLDKNALPFESEDADYLKEKYFLRDECANNNTITLRRVAAVFPSLTCNFLKCNTHIARPISQHELSESENYPRPMTTRCFFSLIPLTPLIGKLKIIEAALLYQLLEQAKFNTLKMENGHVDYAEHMRICVGYCSEDYFSEIEANDKRIQHFDELELTRFGYPICSVYDAAEKLQKMVGNKWVTDITMKFKLTGIDFD